MMKRLAQMAHWHIPVLQTGSSSCIIKASGVERVSVTGNSPGCVASGFPFRASINFRIRLFRAPPAGESAENLPRFANDLCIL